MPYAIRMQSYMDMFKNFLIRTDYHSLFTQKNTTFIKYRMKKIEYKIENLPPCCCLNLGDRDVVWWCQRLPSQ